MHVSTGMLRLWTDRLVPEIARMQQGSETTVAAALGRLRAEDERVAGDAELTDLGRGAAGHHPARAADAPVVSTTA
jgi:hypothetical protein